MNLNNKKHNKIPKSLNGGHSSAKIMRTGRDNATDHETDEPMKQSIAEGIKSSKSGKAMTTDEIICNSQKEFVECIKCIKEYFIPIVQENARLKEENESIKLLNEQKFWSGYKQATQKLREENARLRQALEEIKKLMNDVYFDKEAECLEIIDKVLAGNPKELRIH